MDGVVVQSVALPGFAELARIDDSAVLGIDPLASSHIFDPWTGTVHWASPFGATVTVLGPDHVVMSTGTTVELVQWR
jgi:hypothetical protein